MDPERQRLELEVIGDRSQTPRKGRGEIFFCLYCKRELPRYDQYYHACDRSKRNCPQCRKDCFNPTALRLHQKFCTSPKEGN